MLGAVDRKHEADFDRTHMRVGGIPEVSQRLLLVEVRSGAFHRAAAAQRRPRGSRQDLSRWRTPPPVTCLVERALCFCLASTRGLSLVTALQVPTGKAPLSSSQSCGAHSADLPPLL